jgi:hypothetical protein
MAAHRFEPGEQVSNISEDLIARHDDADDLGGRDEGPCDVPLRRPPAGVEWGAIRARRHVPCEFGLAEPSGDGARGQGNRIKT